MRILVLLLACAAAAAVPKTRARDVWFRISAPRQARRRASFRDNDWKRLRRLLVSEIVPESDKRKWTVEFLVAYWRSPGIESAMAKLLVRHVPPCKMRDALQALAQGRRPPADIKGVMPGFSETSDDTIQPVVAAPPRPDPLEGLLIAKAKEYDAKRAEIQQEQLALLQGASQGSVDQSAVRRKLAEAVPLQDELCKLSARYSAKFGPLALRGLLERENLSGPLEGLQCP